MVHRVQKKQGGEGVSQSSFKSSLWGKMLKSTCILPGRGFPCETGGCSLRLAETLLKGPSSAPAPGCEPLGGESASGRPLGSCLHRAAAPAGLLGKGEKGGKPDPPRGVKLPRAAFRGGEQVFLTYPGERGFLSPVGLSRDLEGAGRGELRVPSPSLPPLAEPPPPSPGRGASDGCGPGCCPAALGGLVLSGALR